MRYKTKGLTSQNRMTHFNTSNAEESAIDLTLALSDNIAENLEWMVSEELYDSDHYSMFAWIPTVPQASETTPTPFNFNKANWDHFRIEINEKITQLDSFNIDDQNIDEIVDSFVSLIINTANIHIPKKNS